MTIINKKSLTAVLLVVIPCFFLLAIMSKNYLLPKNTVVFRIDEIDTTPSRKYPTLKLSIKTREITAIKLYNTYYNFPIFRGVYGRNSSLEYNFSFGPLMIQDRDSQDKNLSTLELSKWLNYQVGKDYKLYGNKEIVLCKMEQDDKTVSYIILNTAPAAIVHLRQEKSVEKEENDVKSSY